MVTLEVRPDGRVHTCGGRYYVRMGRTTTLGTQDEYLRQLQARQPAAPADSAFEAAQRLLRRAVEDEVKTSTLVLGALAIANQHSLGERDWLRQETLGYPRADPSQPAPDAPASDFPDYRQISVHTSKVLPSQFGVLNLDQWITRRPDLFVPQILVYPDSASETEDRLAHLLATPDAFLVHWLGENYGPAHGEHDAAAASYIRSLALQGLLSGLRKRTIQFLLELTDSWGAM